VTDASGLARPAIAPSRSVRRRVVAAALALLWAGVIFWASSRPNPFPFVPSSLLSHDKLLHAAAYALLAGLLRIATASARLQSRRALLVAVALTACYGATDEWHQAHVPGREPDLRDWGADAAGALAGAALGGAFLRRRGGAG
jgi:hypothetical protein